MTLNTIAQNFPDDTSPLLLPHIDVLIASLDSREPTILSNAVDLVAVASDHIPQADISHNERNKYHKILNEGLHLLDDNPDATAEMKQNLNRSVRAISSGNLNLEWATAQVLRTSITTLLLHCLFWLGLIAIYPKSPQVQAMFFWNPKVRKIFGLGYVAIYTHMDTLVAEQIVHTFQI